MKDRQLIRNASGGVTSVRFVSHYTPEQEAEGAEGAALQAKIVKQIETIKTRQARFRFVDPRDTGERVLRQPDNDLARGKRIVRIYYLSEGNEILCFDVGPCHYKTADKVQSEVGAGALRAEQFDAAAIGADAVAQGSDRKPWKGARLVKLPSQYVVQVLDISDQ